MTLLSDVDAREPLTEEDTQRLYGWVNRFKQKDEGRKLAFGPWCMEGRFPASLLQAEAERERVVIAQGLLEIFRDLVPAEGFLYYDDYQHESNRLYPHRASELPWEEIFVDGESISHVAVDYTWGMLSYGWGGDDEIGWCWVCFYGEPLISRLRARLPGFLACLKPADSLRPSGSPRLSLANPICVMETTQGRLEIELYAQETPNTVRHFLTLVRQGYYDGYVLSANPWGREELRFQCPRAEDETFEPDENHPPGRNYNAECDGNPHKMLHGSLIMRHSGKYQPASEQFFVIWPQNSEAMSSYRETVFGRVIEGRNIIARLTAGERVITARVSSS